jgi:hypothetical protein
MVVNRGPRYRVHASSKLLWAEPPKNIRIKEREVGTNLLAVGKLQREQGVHELKVQS